ncbi:MAG: hydroxymethylglutaryl-CoA reductase, degradative [Candidatus Diapherotrites archaeon]|nr:hydroxymethylglutaryl-CoA reductase, degradative [Candidatus Diapherotrites archaeon]
MDSSVSGFYKKSLEERIAIIKEAGQLTEEETAQLKKFAALDFEQANRMIENVIGVQQLPIGIATNFVVNGKDILIPMAIEEPSVVAAACNGARIARALGGFKSKASAPIMIGQIQIVNAEKGAEKKILKAKKELLEKANSMDKTLKKFGGGAKELKAEELKTQKGKMVIVQLLVDVRDAMGANAINTMCEAIAPKLEEISKGKVFLRIISNLAIHRTVKAKAVFSKKALEESFKGKIRGEEIVEAMLNAYAFAEADVFRACTHNKGIMNGIDAVGIATGQDFRAIEAGAHCYASWKNKGEYKPLTKYYKNEKGDLIGEIELPLAIGLVGGATRTHPIAKTCVKILGVKTANELAEIMACVGLANNAAAIRALAVEGIQKGHMKLHARNIAVIAGAQGKDIEDVAEKMINENNVKVDRAKEILGEKN